MGQLPIKLTRRGFFRDLEPEQAMFIAPSCCPVNFRRGQQIFTQGDEASTVYMLQAGEVELHFRPDERFNYSVTTTIVKPGEAFGWSAALGDRTIPRRRFAGRTRKLWRSARRTGACSPPRTNPSGEFWMSEWRRRRPSIKRL